MVATEPQDGRCNASIVDKVGLEVHDDKTGRSYISSDRLEAVVIVRGDEERVVEPEYTDVITYLRNGFDTTAVHLTPTDGTTDPGSPEVVPVEDDDPYVTNHDTEHQGYCERYPMTDEGTEVCPMHGGLSTGAPEGNTNAVTHGLKAKRSNYYQNELTDDEKVLVEEFVDDWIELSRFTRDNTSVVNELYRIAVDQIRLWNAQDEFAEGVVFDQYEDMGPEGEQIFTTQENPANLPYDRLDRTTFRKLKDLGVLDDPESKQAEATSSLAAIYADMNDDE